MSTSPTGTIRQALPTLRKTLVRRINDANTLLNTPTPGHNDSTFEKHREDLEVASKSLERSKVKLEDLDNQWVDILNTQIEQTDLAKEQQLYTNATENATDGYHALIDRADEIFDRLTVRVARMETTQQRATEDVHIASSHNGSISDQHNQPAPSSFRPIDSPLHLPELSLPTFDGDILKFPKFWSIYNTAIHSRTDLSPVAKLSYLIPLLKGPASQIVDGYQINDDNYDLIITRLKERFQRSNDRLVSLLYAELKKVSSCGMRHDDRRKTIDTHERIYRQLEQAGKVLDPGESLVFDLLSKFPPPVIRELDRRYKVGVYSNLSDVRKALEKSITEDELTAGFLKDLSFSKESTPKSSPNNHPYADVDHVESTMATHTRGMRGQSQYPRNRGPTQPAVKGQPSRSREPVQFPCYFCEESHYNAECPRYPTAQSRINRLRQIGRCTRCLRWSHQGECLIPLFCNHCRTEGSHRYSVCFKKFPQRQADRNRQGQNQNSRSFYRRPTSSNGGTSHTSFRAQQSQNNNKYRQNDERAHLATEEDSTQEDDIPENTQRDVVQTVAEIANFSRSCSKNSLFQTAKVDAVNLETGERRTVRLCLDTLSNRSYMLSNTAKSMKLNSKGPDKLRVSVFGTNKNLEVNSEIVSFGLMKRDGSLFEVQANTTKLISNTTVLPDEWPDNEEQKLSAWQHCLADDPFDNDKTIDILIGADYAWDIITGPKSTFDHSSIFLIPSIFGFMLGGSLHYDTPADKDEVAMFCLTSSTCEFPHELGLAATYAKKDGQESGYPDIDEFWNLETIGISECPVQDDDDSAQTAFDESVIYEDEQYHVKFPTIPDKIALLPSNYEMAYSRLQSLTDRLQKNPELLKGYRDTITLQLDKGIVERVPDDEIITDNVVHYLPHHPVVKKSSATTKTRIVYDASSKSRKHDYSLNECLLRGPVILPDLCQLLMRFRTSPFVIISDVEKAFLQVALQKEDRDVTRFLWYKDDTNPSTDPGNLTILRFRSVPFGIISSPFLLGATIQHHLKKEGTEFAKSLASSVYVDNVISGVSDETSAVHYYYDLKALFARAGMNIQEFCSNSKDLMDQIPERDRVKDTDAKVLGIKWDSANDDTIRIIQSSKWSKLNVAQSKRSILRTIAAIFDPLGLYQPATFPAKLMLQQLWLDGASWDASLKEALAEKWSALQESLKPIFDHRVPRFLGTVNPQTSLVVFSDASGKGYGAAVYLRTREAEKPWQINLLFAKSRLVPTKPTAKITLPRLELLGTVIASSAADFCRQALHQPDMPVHLFTDSECVLHWLKSTKQMKVFVERRIEKLRATKNFSFHYVTTQDNPADLLTRGTSAQELIENKQWWYGPSWLKHDVSQWPEVHLPPVSSEVLQEIRTVQSTNVVHTMATTDSPAEITNEALETGTLGIPFDRYSRLQHLIKVSWICLKFLKKRIWNRLPQRLKDQHVSLFKLFDRIEDGHMSPVGHRVTLYQWIKQVQKSTYDEEFAAFEQQKKTTLMKQLNLQLGSDGIMRADGRYENADLPQATLTPILLPRNHEFTRLIIFDIHRQLKHVEWPTVLTKLRQTYWVTQGRAYVQGVLRSCQYCRRFKRNKSFALPPMPPWPAERVKRSAPFQFNGLDYFGPLKVRLKGRKGNHHVVKMWVSLFTCLSIRAVHLEPVVDCTAVEFYRSLIRFVCRRGCPQEIISDNGAQFTLQTILGDRAWERTPTDESLLSYCAQNNISWKFIVELAPWQGGHYERLVGIVKSVLKAAIGRRLLFWSELVTLLAETESIVNSRPITYVNSEIDASFRILRPIDFLLFRPHTSVPNVDTSFRVTDLGEGGRKLAELWKSRERYIDKLWSVWYDEYLLSLREQTNRFHKVKRSRIAINRTPVVGEVVIIRDDDLPRGSWKLGRVVRLLPSSDNNVRAVELRLWNGIHLRRTINYLMPLEIGAENDTTQTQLETTTTQRTEQFGQSQRQSDTQTTINDDNDNDEFYGFSQDGVDRVQSLLQLVDDNESTSTSHDSQ